MAVALLKQKAEKAAVSVAVGGARAALHFLGWAGPCAIARSTWCGLPRGLRVGGLAGDSSD